MGRKIAGLPVWAWGIAAAAGILLGVLVVRRSRSASSPSPAAAPTGPSPYAGLAPTTPGGDAAPADSLSTGTLELLTDALGIQSSALVTQGQTLGNVTLGAQAALTDIATTSINSSVALAQTALEVDSLSQPTYAYAAPVAPAPSPITPPPVTPPPPPPPPPTSTQPQALPVVKAKATPDFVPLGMVTGVHPDAAPLPAGFTRTVAERRGGR